MNSFAFFNHVMWFTRHLFNFLSYSFNLFTLSLRIFFFFGNSVTFGVFDPGRFRPLTLSTLVLSNCVFWPLYDVGHEQCHRRSRLTLYLLVNFHLYCFYKVELWDVYSHNLIAYIGVLYFLSLTIVVCVV